MTLTQPTLGALPGAGTRSMTAAPSLSHILCVTGAPTGGLTVSPPLSGVRRRDGIQPVSPSHPDTGRQVVQLYHQSATDRLGAACNQSVTSTLCHLRTPDHPTVDMSLANQSPL